MSRSPWLAAAMLSVALLAGCADEGPAPAADGHGHADGQDDHGDAGAVAPAGRVEVRIPEGASERGHDGPWFDVERDVFEAPVTLRFINDDDVPHHAFGNYTPVQDPPAWAQAYADGHDHGSDAGEDGGHGGDGHGGDAGGHGGDAGGHGGDGADGHGDGGDAGHGDHPGPGHVAFDVTVQPGAHQDVTIDQPGRIRVGCQPHAWMVDEWHAVAGEATAFAVGVRSLELSGTADGTAAIGHDGDNATDLELHLDAPNLAWVRASLSWDDAEDDGPAGGDANQPDTFRLALVDPSGTVAAEDTLEARDGHLEVVFHADSQGWPERVQGRGQDDAMRSLNDARPDDLAWVGDWTVQVELLRAPGYLPADIDDGGTFHDAPAGTGFDGGQSWNLTVAAVHEWAGIGPGDDVAGDLVLGDAHGDHEH